MIDLPIGHKPHVAPLQERATSVLPDWLGQFQNEEVVANVQRERDPKEKYFFVWFDGWKGTGFVQAEAQFEAQIVREDFLPKNTVFKVEVSAQDRRSIEELKLAFPWPLVEAFEVKTISHAELDARFSGAAVAVTYYPAMFGGMSDVQG